MMVQLLNNRDRKLIDQDVSSVIHDWSNTIEIWIPLPKEQQPGWNRLMNEISGEIQYNRRVGILVERRDQPLSELETNVGGDKFKGKSILCIPTDIVVGYDCLFILDGDTSNPWRVQEIKPRMGENQVTIIKEVGNNGD
jgi:hypothetical protein